jgi:predicted RNase H-like HicB family nuclease
MPIISVEVRIFREGDVYVALCPELELSSFGDDIESAKESFKEALAAFLEECEALGTLDEVLDESGFVKVGGLWVPEEPVLREQLAVAC